jgi:hypothetical protein
VPLTAPDPFKTLGPSGERLVTIVGSIESRHLSRQFGARRRLAFNLAARALVGRPTFIRVSCDQGSIKASARLAFTPSAVVVWFTTRGLKTVNCRGASRARAQR